MFLRAVSLARRLHGPLESSEFKPVDSRKARRALIPFNCPGLRVRQSPVLQSERTNSSANVRPRDNGATLLCRVRRLIKYRAGRNQAGPSGTIEPFSSTCRYSNYR